MYILLIFNIILSVLSLCDCEWTVSGVELPPQSLNGSVFKSAKRYFCAVDLERALTVPESHLLVRGERSWRFPKQNVNFTLAYPMDNNEAEYVITSVEVILYIDGTESRGYLNSGGMLSESISMTFVVPNISLLSYNFEVFGVPKRLLYYKRELFSDESC